MSTPGDTEDPYFAAGKTHYPGTAESRDPIAETMPNRTKTDGRVPNELKSDNNRAGSLTWIMEGHLNYFICSE